MENKSAEQEKHKYREEELSDSNPVKTMTDQVINALDQMIVGQKENIRYMWAALLIGGHVLLEGVPGLGKTRMVKIFSQLFSADYSRVQFTPDLMPSDMTGNMIYDMQTGKFTFRQGPIFTHILLADEVNRTSPKTQAALLEAMEEQQVTLDGQSYPLPDLFFVAATQNPIEYEGTYALPEAQLDRFALKLLIDYPVEEEEKELLKTHQLHQKKSVSITPILQLEEVLALRRQVQQVKVDASIITYLYQIIRETRNHPRISLGASPRAGLDLLSLAQAEALMQGRTYVIPDDVKLMIKPGLRHRVLLEPDGELEGWNTDDILEQIITSTVVPR